MPTPDVFVSSRVIADTLLRQGEPTLNDWIELLKDRRETIRAYFDDFTLETLLRSRVLRRYRNIHTLRADQVTTVDGTVRVGNTAVLETQGIFDLYREGRWYGPTDETDSDLFWGLTREGRWLHGAVRYLLRPQFSALGCRIDRVTIEFNDLENLPLGEEVGKLMPSDVWRKLGAVAKGWYVRHEKLHHNARDLYLKCELESGMLDRISTLSRLSRWAKERDKE